MSSLDSLCLESDVLTTLSKVSSRFSTRCLKRSSVLLSFLPEWLEEFNCSCKWWTWVLSMFSKVRRSCSVNSRPMMRKKLVKNQASISASVLNLSVIFFWTLKIISWIYCGCYYFTVFNRWFFSKSKLLHNNLRIIELGVISLAAAYLFLKLSRNM